MPDVPRCSHECLKAEGEAICQRADTGGGARLYRILCRLKQRYLPRGPAPLRTISFGNLYRPGLSGGVTCEAG